MPDTVATEGDRPAALSADEVRALFRELDSTYATRNADYASRREMYLGEHWGQPGLEKPPAAEKRYTLAANYIRPTVDKAVQMLLGQMPGIQVMPPGVHEQARRLAEGMESVLYNTWERNEAPIVFRRVAWNRTLLGQGLVYFWWDAPAKQVRFKSVAPDNFYPIYDGEDLVECVVVSRRHTRTLRRLYPKIAKDIEPDDEGDNVFDEDRWSRQFGADNPLSTESQAYGTGTRQEPVGGMTTVYDWFDKYGNWTRVMGKAVHTQNLGYGIDSVPVVVFPHSLAGDERDSRTEVDEIMDLNLYLDDLLSDNANIIRRYAHPTIIDKGSGVAPTTVLRVIQRLGGVLPIRKDGEIGFLNYEGQPPDTEAQYNRVLGLIYDLGGKPPSSYGQIVSNQSGVATNMALSPITASAQEASDVFGHRLTVLNGHILALYEKFMAGEEIKVSGSRAKRPGIKAQVYYEATILGSDIGGWRINRIKWPSALRTDDPVYVQNEIAKANADGENPPKQSLYTTLENLGIEDVEMEIDRIGEQLADPRFHPQRMTSAVDAATQMMGNALPEEMAGLNPALQPGGGPLPGIGNDQANEALVQAGSPNKDTIVNGGY